MVLGLGGARKSSSCLTAAGLLLSRVSRPSVLRTVMESTAPSCCTSPY